MLHLYQVSVAHNLRLQELQEEMAELEEEEEQEGFGLGLDKTPAAESHVLEATRGEKQEKNVQSGLWRCYIAFGT